jgi:alkyl hydroperoxide reductase subunit AhpC
VLNALFNQVQGDSNLKNKIKILAVTQGQDQMAAKMWKAVQKVPFPVVPDQDRKLSKALNFSPYPVTVILDKNGKVLWAHIGAMEDAGDGMKGIKQVVK